MAVAIISMLPYIAVARSKHLPYLTRNIVVGIHNEYKCITSEGIAKRYAVYEESDCVAEPQTFVEIARQASVEAFGEDLVAMVVKTGKGFHIYLDLWTDSFLDSLLLASRYRNHLPCLCRDENHVYNSIIILMDYKWERYILRVSPTKHTGDTFTVVYRKSSRDECHEAFLKEVESMYKAFPFPVP
jgi:hypothetical protein